MSESINKSNERLGFTLVETLIAITVLMIAVAGPLTIATKALTAAFYAKNQSTASFLAQEAMEIIKNTRDNNIAGAGETSWLSGFENCIGVSSNHPYCDISVVNNESGFPSVVNNQSCGAGWNTGCQLYVTSQGYDHITSDKQTIFSRYFYLTQVGTGPEYQVIVVVTWDEGNITNEVRLTSELLPALR